MKEIKEMTEEELLELKKQIEKEIEDRKRNSETFVFEFSATTNKYKRVPYVARISWENGKLERKFFDLTKTWGNENITVWGKYEAQNGDIIEKRQNGGVSWEIDNRVWYLIKDGKEILVAHCGNSKEKEKVIKYLKKEISVDELKS